MHRYAIRGAVEEESDGALTPRAGTLYRVIARLLAGGLATETQRTADDAPHPGHPRRYYELTAEGRVALAREATRLRGPAALAEERLGGAGREPPRNCGPALLEPPADRQGTRSRPRGAVPRLPGAAPRVDRP